MLKFYYCSTCGNLIEMIEDSGMVPVCCGEDMEELVPCAIDGAQEKHVPVYTEVPEPTVSPGEKLCTRVITVKVGEMPHPMTEKHCIEWIVVETDHAVYRKHLHCAKNAQVDFCLKKDECIRAIYSYCNIHGLWVSIAE